MLSEIFCDQYMDEGVIRKPIKLHRGLNIVVGGADASNSIGKTTFLLAIDFALGGKTYARKSSSMVRAIGHHTLHFTHTFDGVDYRFCRDTAETKTVWSCDDKRNRLRSMSIEAYKDWLAAKYGLGELGSSFRDLQSPFFRVYGMKHDDVDRPLMSSTSDKVSADLLRLLKLYGRYEEVAEIEEKRENLELDRSAFRNADSRRFIRKAQSAKEYAKNERKIKSLESQMKQMLERCDKGVVEITTEKSGYIATLTDQLIELRRGRDSLARALRAMERDLELISFSKTKNLERLRTYFPGIDIRPIAEIDAFHEENVRNLKEMHRNESADIKARIADLDLQISRIEESIQQAGGISTLPRVAMEEYADLNSLVEQLVRANELYDRDKQFAEDAKEIKSQRESIEQHHFREIESAINEELLSLNRAAVGRGIAAPKIEIVDPDHYTYEIPLDDGTRSRNRGMFLFDIALLRQTPLKFAIHDSPGLKQVEDGHTIGMFNLYSQCEEQIFVAIDKVDKYTESGEVPDVIKENTVLELSRGHELFGIAWNRDIESQAEDIGSDE